MRRNAEMSGSITVEAAIVLPVFICVVISLAMLIKLVYIHDIVQHSIDEAANELAVYAYIYHASDMRKIDESIEENIDDNSEQAEEHFSIAVNAFDVLKNAYGAGNDFAEEISSAVSSEAGFITKADRIISQSRSLAEDGKELSEQGISSIAEIQKSLEEVSQDPAKEAKSIAWMLSKGIYSDAKTLIAVPLIKHTVKKYLYGNASEDIDKRLKKLNITNGFEGMDFYSSTLFQGDENINITVKYKVELPLPVKLLPDLYLIQRSTARAWLNGGDGTGLQGANIWALPNKQRGMKIEELYGGNLPYNFPGIDVYDASSQTGTSIKSINLNSKTYQDAVSLNKRLKQYVDAMKEANIINYENESYPIANKKLIIVIPKGSINENNGAVLEKIKSYAGASSIEITIEEL